MTAGTAPSFLMLGARTAMAAGLLHVGEQIKAIERAVFENPGLAFDLAKTLIESACKAILGERGVVVASDSDLPSLFRTTTSQLPFLPPAASGEVDARRSLAQTLTGLHTAVQGVAELRNRYGFASHGSGVPRPSMESVQALLAAQAADTIVGFLYRVHRQERRPEQEARLEYADNPEFNEYLDETNPQVMVASLAYRPSEVLFYVDNQAYLDLLLDWGTEAAQPPVETVNAANLGDGG